MCDRLGLGYKTWSIKSFLRDSRLSIPEYQRPYKWSKQHVIQLLQDLQFFKDKNQYRLGTIVIHENKLRENEIEWNIVDGQQRTITMVLLIKALKDKFGDNGSGMPNAYLDELSSVKMPEFKFRNKISKINIINNYREIKTLIIDFDISIIDFILNRCEVVVFTLTDISEAFQFFDSQNARGKSLEPHDLLKAFHLREFESNELGTQKELVEVWENEDSKNLSDLFSKFLYRIRGWSNGQSSRYFTKDEISYFKGIKLGDKNSFPYLKGIEIINCFIAEYNNSEQRILDNCNLKYPFQLDQIIINGKLFFEMINHYLRIYKEIREGVIKLAELNDRSKNIFEIINSYDNRWRIGDQYTRMLFETALMFYVDKFGLFEIDSAIFKIFIWSYSLRLKKRRLQLASVDKYVIETREGNLFSLIKHAQTPSQILNWSLNVINSTNEIKANGVDEIKDFFIETKVIYKHNEQ